MSNMSYCRWHNTYRDLRDCAEDLEERGQDEDRPAPLSDDEREARVQLFRTAALMFEQLGVEVDLDAALAALEEVK